MNFISKRFLDGDLCKHIFDFHSVFFSGFESWFNHIHWLFPYRSFKHSKWWRRKL